MVPAEQRDAVRRGRQVERHARGDVLQRHGGGHDGAPQLDVQVACAQPEGEAGEPSGGGELHHSRRCVARHLHQVRRQHPLVRLAVSLSLSLSLSLLPVEPDSARQSPGICTRSGASTHWSALACTPHLQHDSIREFSQASTGLLEIQWRVQ